MQSTASNPKLGIGASLLRKEDARHLRGRGQFVSDIRCPACGRSCSCAARTPTPDPRDNGAAGGKGRVFTAADLPRMKPIRIVTQASGARSPDWPPLATDKARYVGEAIAACVAPTRAEAEDRRHGRGRFRAARRGRRRARADARRRAGARAVGRQRVPRRTIEGGDIEAAARAAESS